MASRAGIERAHLLRRGELLEAATVAWNVVEGIIAVVAGVLASSLVLIGFGIDAFVETASGAVVGWRLHAELRGHLADMSAWKTPDGVYVIGVTQHGPFSSRGTAVMERRAARIAGVLLLGLSGYIIVDAGRRLLGFGAEARGSLLGIMLPAISVVIMPLVGWAKLRTAAALGSGALRTDAYETITCSWLSLTALTGLILNAALGWWWADPLAALAIVPLAVREGFEGWRGEHNGH
jgi:hypothetical protein